MSKQLRPLPARTLAKLKPREARFVSEYLIDHNATRAAEAAGYSKNGAHTAGYGLLQRPAVAEAIDVELQALQQANEISASRILEEFRRLALNDPRGYWREDGTLKSMRELTAEQAAAISSFEVIKKNLTVGDGQVDTVHKIRLWDKGKALENLAKHLGLLNETIDVNVTHTLSDKIARARQRLRGDIIDVT